MLQQTSCVQSTITQESSSYPNSAGSGSLYDKHIVRIKRSRLCACSLTIKHQSMFKLGLAHEYESTASLSWLGNGDHMQVYLQVESKFTHLNHKRSRQLDLWKLCTADCCDISSTSAIGDSRLHLQRPSENCDKTYVSRSNLPESLHRLHVTHHPPTPACSRLPGKQFFQKII